MIESCPECGSEMLHLIPETDPDGKLESAYIECTECNWHTTIDGVTYLKWRKECEELTIIEQMD